MQELYAVESCEIAIKRPEGQVARFAGDLEHKTAGKAERGSFPGSLRDSCARDNPRDEILLHHDQHYE